VSKTQTSRPVNGLSSGRGSVRTPARMARRYRRRGVRLCAAGSRGFPFGAVMAGPAAGTSAAPSSANANQPSVLTTCTARRSASRGFFTIDAGSRAIGRSLGKILLKIVRSGISSPLWPGRCTCPERSRRICGPAAFGW